MFTPLLAAVAFQKARLHLQPSTLTFAFPRSQGDGPISYVLPHEWVIAGFQRIACVSLKKRIGWAKDFSELGMTMPARLVKTFELGDRLYVLLADLRAHDFPQVLVEIDPVSGKVLSSIRIGGSAKVSINAGKHRIYVLSGIDYAKNRATSNTFDADLQKVRAREDQPILFDGFFYYRGRLAWLEHPVLGYVQKIYPTKTGLFISYWNDTVDEPYKFRNVQGLAFLPIGRIKRFLNGRYKPVILYKAYGKYLNDWPKGPVYGIVSGSTLDGVFVSLMSLNGGYRTEFIAARGSGVTHRIIGSSKQLPREGSACVSFWSGLDGLIVGSVDRWRIRLDMPLGNFWTYCNENEIATASSEWNRDTVAVTIRFPRVHKIREGHSRSQ